MNQNKRLSMIRDSHVLIGGIAIVFFLVTLSSGFSFLWAAEVFTKAQREFVAAEVKRVIKALKAAEKQDEEGMPEWSKGVNVSPAVVEYKRGAKVVISGSGFKPKQELGIHVGRGGPGSDISLLVEPQPVTNEFGAFASVWTINREIRQKLIMATTYTVTVVDQNGKTWGSAPLVFCDRKTKKAPVCGLLAKGKKGKRARKP